METEVKIIGLLFVVCGVLLFGAGCRDKYEPPEIPLDLLAASDLLEVARHGDAQAQLMMGRRYFHGAGVETNVAEAVKWYEKAAAQDLGEAKYELAMCLFRGIKVRFGEDEAVDYLRFAAEEEVPPAQEMLGSLYFHGKIVERDEAVATNYWTRAAENGDRLARRNLAEWQLEQLRIHGRSAQSPTDHEESAAR